MILAFQLAMPNPPSWNGKWSGEGRVYAVLKTYKSQKAIAKARELIGPHFYHWSDGWTACINVSEVTPAESKRLRNKSVGFAGYEWMIRSLETYGKIYADHEIPKQEKAHA